MALTNFFAVNPLQGQQVQNPTVTAPDANQVVQSSLESFLNPNSTYIQNARRRGMETAAVRGGINSSIAAGASERAALEAAAPLAQQAVQIQQNREQANIDDWLSNQNFNRSLFGTFQQGIFQNTSNMLSTIQQYALEDPELYTPDVTSGLSNFFTQNMQDIMKRYFSG